jgi:GLPGLI family protein
MTKLLIATLLICNAASAQVKEGKVVYERKINMHKDLPPEAEQFRAMMPEFQTSKMELLYNGTQSLFHSVPSDEEDQMPQAGEGGGRRMMFRMGGADAETFRDYDKELIVESRELGPKKYIINDTLKSLKWKLEEDTMTIAGYLCHKATTTQEASIRRIGMRRGGDTATTAPQTQMQPVVAWYTEQVESQAGPDNFFGLPGLILKIDINNGSMVYTPVSIETLGKATVKQPTSGKTITRAEYRKMMEEQFRNMRGPGGPGGPGGGGANFRTF